MEVELCGFGLKYPTMLASGVLGISFDFFPRVISNFCGAIVSKSVGLLPREGYKNPTMTGVEAGYLNAIGLSNPGIHAFIEELKKSIEIPLVISIFADTPENFSNLARKLNEYEFLALELNLSCPHVQDVGSEIGNDLELTSRVVSRVKSATRKPVFAKMPASIANVPRWGQTVEDAGADGIVAINTIRAMKIDVETRKPILSNKIGGLSGSAIKTVGVRAVYELFESVKIPIIGVGGVSQWNDAVEYFLAGASCVQIGSAMADDYLITFGEIYRGILNYMKRMDYSKVSEMIGSAHN